MEHLIDSLLFLSLKWKFVSYIIFMMYLNYDHNEFVTLTLHSTFSSGYSEGKLDSTVAGPTFQICAFLRILKNDSVN